MPRSPKIRSAPAASAVADAPVVIAAARIRRSVALRDLDIAPENLRYGEAPDDDIPVLAETLLAAGQHQPLTVRPGRRREAAHMALDGRRRILALRLLLETGRIDDGFPVEVVVETDPARQSAAALLTNTAVPVHVADVIASIGRMLKSRLTIPVIARALGYAEVEIKRLALLSALPSQAIEALRGGKLNLRQARLLARLSDPAEQTELARLALQGGGFPEWRVTERLDARTVTSRDDRCALVGAEPYAAAGGRTESDLFGERADVLLDPSILTDLWTARARQVALVFESEGLAVHVTAGDAPDLPEDLEAAGHVHGGQLSAAEMTAYRLAREVFDAAGEAAGEQLIARGDGEALQTALIDLVRARLAMDQIGWGGRSATTLVLRPSLRTGLAVKAFTPVAPEPEETSADEATPGRDVRAAAPAYQAPSAPAPDPEVEGIGHVLHALRTDVATRGLIRAMADDPGVALTALIAGLFGQVALRALGHRSDSALALTVSSFNPVGGRVVDALDGEVRQRLDGRRADWEASGRTVIGWIHGLAHGDKMALLAELTALSLDLRETRTTLIRSAARAEAAELAALSGADISLHWTPDAEFLRSHSKALLLGMLQDMGDADPRSAALKKADLVESVAVRAAETVWAPRCLNWAVEPSQDETRQGETVDETISEASACEETAGDAGQMKDSLADGAGDFVLTQSGLAALNQAA